MALKVASRRMRSPRSHGRQGVAGLTAVTCGTRNTFSIPNLVLSSALLDDCTSAGELIELKVPKQKQIEQSRFQTKEIDKSRICEGLLCTKAYLELEGEDLGVGKWYNLSIAFFSRLSGSSDMLL
jgi:hypothetical protein